MFISVLFLSVALAMDCLTVSIVSGVVLQRMEWPTVLRMSTLFGLFQGLMPLLGWLAMSFFASGLLLYGHIVAFVFLSFVGGRMIWESFREGEPTMFNPHKLRTQLLLAVATSIDALAIGASYAVLGYDKLSLLALPFLIIGLVSFLFGVMGQVLGVRFGKITRRHIRPELLGGVILVIIGLKVLLGF